QTNTFNLFGASVGIANGSLTVDKGILCGGDVIILSGHVASEKSKEFKGLVGELKDKVLAQAREAKQQVDTSEDKISEQGTASYESTFTDGLYDDEQPGNEDVIDAAQFTFRTAEQYRTSGFAMLETRWQQLARLAGQSPGTWEEKPSHAETW